MGHVRLPSWKHMHHHWFHIFLPSKVHTCHPILYSCASTPLEVSHTQLHTLLPWSLFGPFSTHTSDMRRSSQANHCKTPVYSIPALADNSTGSTHPVLILSSVSDYLWLDPLERKNKFPNMGALKSMCRPRPRRAGGFQRLHRSTCTPNIERQIGMPYI